MSIYRPVRIEADGTPVYDFTKPEPVMPNTAVNEGGIYADSADGSLYTLSFANNAPNLAHWAKDGSLLWGFRGAVYWPAALSLPPQRSGKMWGPTALLGKAGDYTGFNTYFGVCHLYTADGLPVGTVFKDYRSGDAAPSELISCENGNGRLIKLKGTDRYLILAGDQDGRVSEILGLDTVKRLPGWDT